MPDRTVRKGDRDQNIVIVVAARTVGGRDSVNAGGKRAAKKLHHVDEVAAFADKASALIGMLHPVRERYEAGVDAIVHGQGLGASRK